MNEAVKPTALRNSGAWAATLMVGAAACMALTTCTPAVSSLEKVRETGVLRVATVNSPTTYYQGPDGPTGFEYDLARGFAKKLGVELQIRLAASPRAALEMVQNGRADLAAAGLDVNDPGFEAVRFSRPVSTVTQQVVFRMGNTAPNGFGDLTGTLVVPAGSLQSRSLALLQKQHEGLAWRESRDDDSEDLLEKVATGQIDYTIANSDLVSLNQRYYPKLLVAFPLTGSQKLAWALSQDRDSSLFNAVGDYLSSVGDDEIARLRDRHFGHLEQVDVMGALALASHAQSRLPRYRAAFEKAAHASGLDWRLLAAIAYQESHWDPEAISPTGVRGIMQLTALTALDLKVANRDDPLQSIGGGALYLRAIVDQLPAEIVEPDRTWLALAAYNMGVGHLSDVRELTASLGGDSRRWLDVSTSLPLLGQPKWYKQTHHGYARGRQAMQFVGNVRTYYDMLVWLTDGPKLTAVALPGTPTHPAFTPSARSAPDTVEILKIRSPIL